MPDLKEAVSRFGAEAQLVDVLSGASRMAISDARRDLPALTPAATRLD